MERQFRKIKVIWPLSGVFLVMGASLLVAQAQDRFDDKRAALELRKTTGAHTRFLWTHQLSPQSEMQAQDGLELWVLDSDDGKGARKIGESASYHRPLFTADGNRIVWTNHPQRNMHVINFDGSGTRTLGKGQMGDVWRDHETGIDWVYYRDLAEGKLKREEHIYEGGKVWRLQLDNPEIKELVWDKTPICHGTLFYLSLTDDGKYGASAFPWAGNGIAAFPNGAYQKIHFGCWSGLSPDNSGRFFSFDGDHRYLHLFDWGGVNSREIRLDVVPEYKSGDVYFPRWTNHPDFMVMSHGPRTYLAKFNQDCTAIESFTKVADASDQLPQKHWLGYPDCWIDPGPNFKVADTSNLKSLDAVAEVKGAWPGETEDLVFAWKNRAATNRVPTDNGNFLPIELEESGLARYGRQWQMHLRGGQFTPNNDEAARHIIAACQKAKAMTIELVVNPAIPRQDGTILVLEAPSGEAANLRVLQWLNRINIELPRSVVFDKGDKAGQAKVLFSLVMPKSGPAHVVFVYEKGRVDAYLNGEFQDSQSMGGFHKWEKDDFAAWTDEAKLIFGRRVDGSDPWQGQLEGVSIHARALARDEARARYQLYAQDLKDRTPAPQSSVTARLVSRSAVPSEQDMGIYSRALVTNEYEVLKVNQGEPVSGKILVQQYAVVDRKPLPIVSEWDIGKEYSLVLEPINDHPELEGERLFEDVDNLDAPVFFEVSSW